MKSIITFLFCFFSGYIIAQETATLYIVDGQDDAWQTYYVYIGSTDSVGDMNVDGQYLSAGFDAWMEDPPYLFHYIGLRYLNVPIPLGSTINSAAIQFTSFSANAKPDKLWIRGVMDPSPQAFSPEPFNISNRPLSESFVRWDVQEWQAFIPGPAQKTPNLKVVIQDMIDQPGYAQNKPMAFVIRGGFTLAADTTLPRQACSYEYMGDFYAPVLTIIYTAPSSVDEPAQADAIAIYPNPLRDDLHVSFTSRNTDNYYICISDMNGKMLGQVYKGYLTPGEHNLTISVEELKLDGGVYLLSLCSSRVQHTKKIIVR
jgi:hypothetical protein